MNTHGKGGGARPSACRSRTESSKPRVSHLEDADDGLPLKSFEIGSELKQGGDQWLLTGELTVLGGSTPLDVRIDKVATNGSSFIASAAGVVDRYAFGVTKAKVMAGRRLEFTGTIHAHSDADRGGSVDTSSSAIPSHDKEGAR